MGLQDSLKKSSSLMDERDKAYQEFFKSILLLSSTLFGVLISFYTKHDNFYINLCFAVSVLLLALGILGGAISLYYHLHIRRKLFDAHKKAIIKQYNERSEHADPVFLRESKLFSVCEKTSYIALCSAVVSFCIYIVINVVV